MFISFLGLGQGGGNIADKAASLGFYSASINFSQRDLDSLEYIEENLRLKLVGSEGIGKQRGEAISLMNNNWDLALNFVKENFSHSSIEIIFVPFATGGGSGSGISPVLLQMLTESMTDKVFVAIPIIPDKQESFIAQKNCLETFEDLSTLDICILPIDNDKAKSTMSNIGKNLLYTSTNEYVINMIEKLVAYTEKHSKYGVLDKKDLKNIFKTSGLCTITETELIGLSNKFEISEHGIISNIKESWVNTLFADIEFDQILCSGFIFDGQEKLMELINIKDIYASFGNKMPISLYEGYYNKENGGKVITILSGLSWCNKRLKEIDQIIMETNYTFKDLNKTPVFKSKLTEVSLPFAKNKENKINDISSIIKKFKR